MRRLTGLFLILFVMVGVAEAGEWIIDNVFCAGYVGWFNSLVLDSLDSPHISFFDYSYHNEALRYAYWNGTMWDIEIVDSNGYAGEYSSIAIDSHDRPHISYTGNNVNLKYAHWDGSSWQIETVDSVGVCTSLALDSFNNPHISYCDHHNDYLKYAHWDGSSWQIEIVDTEVGAGEQDSLALDSSDNPHISYYDNSMEDLKYARWNGSVWLIEVVDSEGSVGRGASLALDSSDNPHISYYDSLNSDIKFASWSDFIWNIDIVDSSDNVHGNLSLALDSSNNPYISYCYDYEFDLLKLARRNGTIWEVETVDTGDVGMFSSLALDSNANPCISYYDNKYEYDLKYAWWDPTAAVDDRLLSAEIADEGVLLSWSIVGDEPASLRILRSSDSTETLHPLGELNGSATSWLDVSAEAGVEYSYYLEVTELDGTVSRFGPSEVVVPGTVSELTLSDPFPNPADETLTIHYELTQNATVELSIYDLSGRLVETLVSGEQTAGRHSVSWDSSASATGVYLLRLEANGEAITKRAVISR